MQAVSTPSEKQKRAPRTGYAARRRGPFAIGRSFSRPSGMPPGPPPQGPPRPPSPAAENSRGIPEDSPAAAARCRPGSRTGYPPGAFSDPFRSPHRRDSRTTSGPPLHSGSRRGPPAPLPRRSTLTKWPGAPPRSDPDPAHTGRRYSRSPGSQSRSPTGIPSQGRKARRRFAGRCRWG